MIYANKQNHPGGEYMITENAPDVKAEIDAIEITDDCLTGRAGMAGFSRYLHSTGITNILAKTFSFLKKSKKGTGLRSMFHQLLCYFFDGTSFHLTRFDKLKEDPGPYVSYLRTDCQPFLFNFLFFDFTFFFYKYNDI